MSTTPTPAALHLLTVPEGVSIRGFGPDNRYRLDPTRPTLIGRSPECDIILFLDGMGGRKNSMIEWRQGAWVLQHMGHSLPIFALLPGRAERENVRVIRLEHGTIIEPGPLFQIAFLELPSDEEADEQR